MSDTVSKDTKVTIGFAVTVVLGIVWSLQQQFALQGQVMVIQRDILELRKELARFENLAGDRWTKTMHKQFEALLQAKNPTLVVPKTP